MEFKIKKSLLEKTLNSIVKLIPPRSLYTVLQNIIIETKDSSLSIEGTDLDVFIKKVIPTELKAEGKTLLPGRKILEITREANVDELNFKLQELNLQITAGNAHFNIPALDYHEFPEVPKFPGKKWFEINIGTLMRMVETVAFMVSKDISRKPMSGILLQLKDNELRLVATDGARLGLARQELRQIPGELILIPKVFELFDVDKPDEYVEAFIEERIAGFKFMDTTIISRLIEGPYPNYEDVIPKNFSGRCTIEKSILEGGLKRVSLVTNPGLRSVKFDFQDGNILLSAASPDIGEAKEAIPCRYEGERLGIWYNAGYLLEICRHIMVDELEIQLTSATTASVIKPKNVDNLIYLLMPLRIDSYE